LSNIAQEITTRVASHHAEHPLELGVPVQAIRARFGGGGEVVDSVLNAEISAGRLVSSDGLIARPGWVPTPTPQLASFLDAVLSQLDKSGVEPPTVGELSASLGADAGELLRFLERRGEVVQVEQDRYYARAHLGSLVERLRSAMKGGGEVGPSELRESLGLSRKYLIPFLEYCDRVGYTSRQAGGRVWRSP
jgi:selenocysteine-specific elongation factor